MPANIINGKEIASAIKLAIAEELKKIKTDTGREAGLAVVLVGDDPASIVYVRNKKKACQEVGIRSSEYRLPKETSQDALLKLIASLNKNPEIHGILVQLPLPPHIQTDKIIEATNPDKDVDGFHPVNVGKLVANTASLISCTPLAIITLLDKSGIPIEGRKVVIVGRSNIVGKPAALLFLHRNATVTICHSRTKNLSDYTLRADILVAAIGKPAFVKADMIKKGAVVIDVGINRDEAGLIGDVDFPSAKEKVSYITPVPGGVGPMTIAMLMKNTLTAFKQQQIDNGII
ncbi:MAG: bifunctional 5,10-methylene-tetrahydrofolate dehydrogenase/5,10-methylene-tetrahydrofolate cyclohydrolase [Nitrospinae bacterium RIFCSPLOWO2_02_FULL_39_110]|nr:MAG: bifunctional 5,10-methylene-tetrahydrofolate dehydrogenase/5,10-methylene-tetrahydrofolate cyclohydrolase [Nitrospinae bacterium RIFCSPHIGHO2_02_39_11]OGW01040.1 MAG: bifunctional 5,10-methylene-tetrahydrofolate dehydrogenase/5,10-methylene-tetrahydrofolate cyclohydrolase [Nitrospinae bacterium RIFCSPHIGHO2_12_FULL_39_42]OGW01906.1 MAG: bifunctional 5,10-methylene-tetrahydrofolate dehydrogenase/5,10-methylene-tetrahydrofolate cyclohydrolase [Nitrospinae bacterium RIFCSPLOWO2_02_39_17]OGW